MRFVVVAVVALLAGCPSAATTTTSRTTPENGPTFVDTPPQASIACEDALAEVVKLAGEPHNDNAMGAIFVRHCNAESWSADVRSCFKRQPAADIQQCVEMLSNSQRQELGEELKTLATE